MTISAASLRKLAALNLDPSQMAGVLDMLAEQQEQEEARLAATAARTRRYRQRGGDQIPADMRAAVMARDNATCQECGSLEYPQLDHIHPVSKGGETSMANLQVLCRPCNARKKDRIRKAIPRNSAEFDGSSAEFRVEVSPKKETSPTPPKEKTTPSQSEPNGSSKTPRQALECVLDRKRAGAVIDHRQRIGKPLTAHAAELLAGKLAKCADPNFAADEMVANGWQGFKPEWLDRQQARGSPQSIASKAPSQAEVFAFIARNSSDDPGPEYDDSRSARQAIPHLR